VTLAAEPEPGLVDLIELAVDYADRLVARGVRDTHRAAAGRVYAAVNAGTGGAGRLSERTHGAVLTTVHAGLGAGFSAARAALRLASRAGVGPRVDDHPASRFVTAAVHGLIGDRIAEEQPQLAIRMAVRRDGRDVPLTPEGLRAAFPEPTGRVAVFVHGMSESESFWNRGSDDGAATYADTLTALGWTPVFLRANTGLPVLENGVHLSALLRDLVRAWPVHLDRIALLGHSMGGLIVRAACDVRVEPDAWTDRVTDVVTLGSPHLGSAVARGFTKAADLLSRLPETAAVGRFLDHRSAGVLDLDWGLRTAPLPHVRLRLVAGSLRGTTTHPVSALLGDSLVRVPSALGRDWASGRHLFPGADVLHVGDADHFDLLNHPRIHTALEDWLR
jgi:hypothetical protein